MGYFGGFCCLVLVALAAGLSAASAAVHKVGDAAGWTTLGNINYTAWAAKETFHVGDIVLFKYNNKFHDVLEVSKAEFDSCNVTKPIKLYNSGNDSITIKTAGHHYFFCGFPGHCSIGQKVDISTVSSAAPSSAPSPSIPAPAPVPAPAPGGSGSGSSSGGGNAPAAGPTPSNASTTTYKGWSLVLLSIAIAAFTTSFFAVSA